jgi:5-methyltetrahydrofolate--homocysteine methyltransferase
LGGKLHGAEFERLLETEFRPRLARMQQQVAEEGWLRPAAVYAYLPANSLSNELILFDPIDRERELARLSFPRQPERDRLCLADYFAPLSGGVRDVAVLQAVTVGAAATEAVDRLQAAGEYAEAYFLHGLAVEAAEGLAEHVHRVVRAELGLAGTQGKRYSWGYPACPEIEQQDLVLRLLDAEQRIGLGLTAGFQLVPEQSTAALVVHHPQAKYYSTSSSAMAEPAR